MRQIRRSVFETNSSSSHSLAYSKKDRGWNYNLPVNKEGVLTVTLGEYGWGPEILRTPMEKLSYYITDNFGGYAIDDIKELNNIFEENEKAEALFKVIKEKCPNVKTIKIKPMHSKWYKFGYVDHQSCGTSNSEEDIEKLIFDNSVIILIDNDNSCYYEDYISYWSDDEEDKPEKDIEELFDLKRGK